MKLYRFETPDDTYCVAARDVQHAREELDFYRVQSGYLTIEQAAAITPECDGVDYPTWDEFVAKHQPIKNRLADEGEEDAPYDGHMFETYGKEMEFVRTVAHNLIFTLVDTDGYTYVIPGFHLVNRMGHLVAGVAWTDEQTTFLTD